MTIVNILLIAIILLLCGYIYVINEDFKEKLSELKSNNKYMENKVKQLEKLLKEKDGK